MRKDEGEQCVSWESTSSEPRRRQQLLALVDSQNQHELISRKTGILFINAAANFRNKPSIRLISHGPAHLNNRAIELLMRDAGQTSDSVEIASGKYPRGAARQPMHWPRVPLAFMRAITVHGPLRGVDGPALDDGQVVAELVHMVVNELLYGLILAADVLGLPAAVGRAARFAQRDRPAVVLRRGALVPVLPLDAAQGESAEQDWERSVLEDGVHERAVACLMCSRKMDV
ncbi:hypothetical protein BDK51DRAFT_41099 [Blyttiomyces helicus]|uniref:Uncharacterized protein n=1 Tax=Blyttiomyces helicus TaxID=388810 RepID=A0A4P9VVS2_9FUNG|nr:hypothetical protein BDK51DRAFT_41099 [Blyttiomyces helicus]|eukprot:RKO83232.1 hypothetical protein BDK51DRAFT_41099 [Blyttiomyces helicus]